jgi:tRNA pseudouridine38-40 synthase
MAVLLEYDGTAYRGSQYQENGPSIQAVLESSIRELSGDDGRVAFAGRTDTGVHALGQVAAFDTASRLTPAEFVSGLNHFLPPDIAVRAAREVQREFDPRRDARMRSYRYEIENRAVRSPLRRDRAWFVERELDVPAMQGAAKALEGAHDFAAFAGAYEGSTRRTLRRCEVTAGGGGLVRLEMQSRSFLPHQVRRTAGALVEVGLGRLKREELLALRDGARPSSAGPAAPGCGLYLVSVEYDGLAFEPGKVDGTR